MVSLISRGVWQVGLMSGLAAVLVIGSGVAPRSIAAPAEAATPPPDGTSSQQAAVTVTGSGTVELVPDVARLIVSVQTAAPTASAAEAQNATAVDSVLSRMVRAGVASSDIKTLGLQIWPQYDYRSGQPLLTGFMATQTLQATIHDLHRIGAVIDAAVAGGATSVQGITYDINDHSAASAQALTKAVRDAQAKARAMADAAGVRLGAVVSMTDIESSPYPFPIVRSAAPSAGNGATQVSPPDVQLTMSVTVGWSIA
jgi:uncharacterized protein